MINDTATELPIWEITRPANVSDIKVAKYLIQGACSIFDLNVQTVMGDANYDSEDLLKYIINDLNAKPIIPHNPRNEQVKGYQVKNGKVICDAGLEMHPKGKMRPKKTGILYFQHPVQSFMTNKSDINTSHALLCIRSFSKARVATHSFDSNPASGLKLAIIHRNSKNFIKNVPLLKGFSHAYWPSQCKIQQ